MENPNGRVIPYFKISKAREENSCGMGRKFVQIKGYLVAIPQGACRDL
jgi:hypothetical protein